MEARLLFLFYVSAAAAASAVSTSTIKTWFDLPGLRAAISQKAMIQCCYSCTCKPDVMWIQIIMVSQNSSEVNVVDLKNGRAEIRQEEKSETLQCSNLMLKDLVLNDTGLYQCTLKESNKTVKTPGTYLQVYEPVIMILNIDERSKNSIITAEGVFLLLFVLLPGIVLICKSKGLNEVEKQKGKDEENIYEGLNLDDCNSTYHQIQRSLVQGPYQDVINNDDEDIQLEKP
ncbi:B-cell antigen receptor complex-associated protein alpha chain [Neoarius graeffei]|uniref:B-cell antigen receptor complex-associated protein alpha chain n=1 Tax=Neoarius graeffei TaxID=443677 RepID=UPI00298D3A2B|nr:B-cell antigen receptor complex-associated protein alpha chain [Neoarius graeffei]